MENLKYLFGPAPSRRLGSSLGINVIPSKICTMDCIYCEAGATLNKTIIRSEYSSAEDIIKEFRDNFGRFSAITDVITITGAGEPTLNIKLNEILRGVRKYCGNTPVAILTNSSLLHDEDVFNTLLDFDIVVPSYDAASEKIMRKIDRHHKDINADIIAESLIRFCKAYKGKLYLEILLCEGINDSEEEWEKIAALFKNVPITKLQIGTVTRPPAASIAKAVSKSVLESANNFFASFGFPSETSLKAFKGGKVNILQEDIKEKISALLKLRPCTLKDISEVFRIKSEDAEKYILNMISEGVIIAEDFNGENYYSHKYLTKLKNTLNK